MLSYISLIAANNKNLNVVMFLLPMFTCFIRQCVCASADLLDDRRNELIDVKRHLITETEVPVC